MSFCEDEDEQTGDVAGITEIFYSYCGMCYVGGTEKVRQCKRAAFRYSVECIFLTGFDMSDGSPRSTANLWADPCVYVSRMWRAFCFHVSMSRHTVRSIPK